MTILAIWALAAIATALYIHHRFTTNPTRHRELDEALDNVETRMWMTANPQRSATIIAYIGIAIWAAAWPIYWPAHLYSRLTRKDTP
jgi:hypothetical protein